MPKKKTETPTETPKKKKVDAVDIINRNGDYVRTYDRERHGDDFMDLAKEFIREVPDAPNINKGRKIVPNPYRGITTVNVKNKETGKLVATYTQEGNGYGFREDAIIRATQTMDRLGRSDQIVGIVEEVK